MDSTNKTFTQYDALVQFIAKFNSYLDNLALRLPPTPECKNFVSQFKGLAKREPKEIAALAENQIKPYRGNMVGLLEATARHFGVPLEHIKPEDARGLVKYLDALDQIISL